MQMGFCSNWIKKGDRLLFTGVIKKVACPLLWKLLFAGGEELFDVSDLFGDVFGKDLATVLCD
jgi:hypothetical protein